MTPAIERTTEQRAPHGKSRMRPGDVVRVGTTGLRSRPTRAILSALGIAIGISAMIAVVGISSSSQAKLNNDLQSLGTNMLTAQAGKDIFGKPTTLPANTVAQIQRINGVESASSTAALANHHIYRNSLIAPGQTGGLSVQVADLNLLNVVSGKIRTGTWLNRATAEYPAVVLGADTADRLGIHTPGSSVRIGNQNFTVVGILDPVPLAPDLNTAALIGSEIAARLFGFDGNPVRIYERSSDESVETVRPLIAPTANPQAPRDVEVSRPSDALAAKYAADQAFTGLLLGLGSIALLVGGIGVANTMVISVLERRREIGLRRALGATRGHIRSQFLVEALLLSAMGGVVGAALGTGVTAIIATANGWPVAVPWPVLGAGVLATLAIGAIAGLYPAIRAARTPPTTALSG
ncbi:ABC transporter permease [Arthrobacter sp. GMC3]|uniref:ABC transporter permease n=1 Tax=Arthrobacter sp. GMC3 TaxID=2058894 RepID=UPI000CE2C7C1|nr:ABC transporter permease [Arthrobacter sp. GMC3]